MRTNDRAIVLASGGLDSTVALAQAHRELEVRMVLFIDYGQRAGEREREAVISIASYYGLPFRQIDMPWLATTAPEGMRAASVDGKKPELDGLDTVWVPNRNGVFLNTAAAFAEAYDCATVVAGFNREEAREFPDNSADYVDRINRAFELSTRKRVVVESPTIDLDKREILILGAELHAPLDHIWSCYQAGESMCGVCASCRRLVAAMTSLPPDARPRVHFQASS
jgi:7-cyano-7-deazaguanine synthase